MAHQCVDKMKYHPLILIVALLFICTKAWTNDDLSADFQQILHKTETQIVQAQKVNGLWRDTRQLIKQAKDLANTGMYKDGITLLHKAHKQALLGYQQAIDQINKKLTPTYLRSKN